MHHQRVWLAALLLAGFMAPAARAGDFSAGVVASTLGFGAEAGYAFNARLALRVAGHAFSLDQDGEESGIDYEADLDLSNFGAYLDWHPFAGAFRLSAGWFATDNRLEGTGRPRAGGGYDIGGVTFTTAEVGTLQAQVDLGSSAPFLGLGWLWGRNDGGLIFSVDLGVLFQGSPDVELRSVGGTLSANPVLLDALAAEASELEDDLDQYELYPVVALGLGYRF